MKKNDYKLPIRIELHRTDKWDIIPVVYKEEREYKFDRTKTFFLLLIITNVVCAVASIIFFLAFHTDIF